MVGINGLSVHKSYDVIIMCVLGWGGGKELHFSTCGLHTVWSLIYPGLGDKVIWIQTGTCQSLGC